MTPIYQAIQTKFLGPTDTLGSRVKATAERGSITLSWDHALNSTDNHRAAAVALARRYGWPEDMIGGGLPGSGYVWTVMPRDLVRAELLAALRAMLAKHDDRDAPSDLWPAEAAQARDAIAKAGG